MTKYNVEITEDERMILMEILVDPYHFEHLSEVGQIKLAGLIVKFGTCDLPKKSKRG